MRTPTVADAMVAHHGRPERACSSSNARCTAAVGPTERHTQWMHRESTLSKRLHALQA